MSGSRSWLVVNSDTLQPHPDALQFVLYLRGGSRSPNTVRAYTRAVVRFLTWRERTGVPWRSASLPTGPVQDLVGVDPKSDWLGPLGPVGRPDADSDVRVPAVRGSLRSGGLGGGCPAERTPLPRPCAPRVRRRGEWPVRQHPLPGSAYACGYGTLRGAADRDVILLAPRARDARTCSR